ncbi:hypothetical protein ES708_05020 [subsurface metagenome]
MKRLTFIVILLAMSVKVMGQKMKKEMIFERSMCNAELLAHHYVLEVNQNYDESDTINIVMIIFNAQEMNQTIWAQPPRNYINLFRGTPIEFHDFLSAIQTIHKTEEEETFITLYGKTISIEKFMCVRGIWIVNPAGGSHWFYVKDIDRFKKEHAAWCEKNSIPYLNEKLE